MGYYSAKIGPQGKYNAIRTKGEMTLFTVYALSGKTKVFLPYTDESNGQSRKRLKNAVRKQFLK